MKRDSNFNSATLVVLLIGLMLGGFIATQTLLITEKPKESSPYPNVNANVGEPSLNVNAGDTGVSSGSPNVMVWVNTSSGVYHCPGTQWYGNTKSGKYMTQKEAQSKGYRPAHKSVCG
jgi:hypothetical protein